MVFAFEKVEDYAAVCGVETAFDGQEGFETGQQVETAAGEVPVGFGQGVFEQVPAQDGLPGAFFRLLDHRPHQVDAGVASGQAVFLFHIEPQIPQPASGVDDGRS